MIYTVTLNPSLDYVMKLDHFKDGFTNRSKSEDVHVGGKGINVSIILKELGFDSVSLAFIAGFSGDEIKRQLEEKQIRSELIRVEEGFSRINVKLKYDYESEINASGPAITSKDLTKLLDRLSNLNDGDVLVLSGSIPKSLNDDSYEKIIEKLKEKRIKVVVDAVGKNLTNTFKHKIFLCKPNIDELQDIFNVEIKTEKEIFFYARKIVKMGCEHVIVSMGKDGALYVNEQGESIILKALKGELKNSVGAGDSMVAGFIAGILDKLSYKDAFKLALASASATAFSETLATKEEICMLLNNMNREE